MTLKMLPRRKAHVVQVAPLPAVSFSTLTLDWEKTFSVASMTFSPGQIAIVFLTGIHRWFLSCTGQTDFDGDVVAETYYSCVYQRPYDLTPSPLFQLGRI